MPPDKEWDFFISHASEDKEEIAKPLAEALQSIGFKVWYDEFTLKLGDSLNQTINPGLASSKRGIAILSNSFLAKNWTRNELNALVAQEMASGEPKILPILHNITNQELREHFPTLVDKKNISSSEGLEEVIRAIIRAVEDTLPLPEWLPSPAHDILFITNVPAAFQQISEFKTWTFSEEEIKNLWETLWALDIKTRTRLRTLTNSSTILDTLRKIYTEELLRPPDLSIEPIDVALHGPYLLSEGVSKFSLDFVRKLIRKSDEYSKKHPDAKIPKDTLVNLSRMRTGTDLVDIITSAHAYHFHHDEPKNEAEADILTAFHQAIEDADILYDVPSERAHMTLTFTQEIQGLEEAGFYVYGALTRGTWAWTSQAKVKKVKMQVAYISVNRHNLDHFTLIQENPE